MMLVTAYKKPTFALSLFAVELILGSRGGWLKLGADAVNDGGIGIRILLFVAFMIGWGLSVVRTKSWGLLKESSRSKWILPYLALVAVLVWGAVRGFVLHQPFLVVDANAWGFLLLLLPASYLWRQSPGQLKADVRSMLPAALGTLTVLTLGLFVLFSQSLVLHEEELPKRGTIKEADIPEDLPLLPFESSPHVWSFSRYKNVFHGERASGRDAEKPQVDFLEQKKEAFPSIAKPQVTPFVPVKKEDDQEVELQKTPLTRGDESLVVLAGVMLLVIILILGYMYSNGRL
jgi:hypothetical protein